jgi:hypothetical protein
VRRVRGVKHRGKDEPTEDKRAIEEDWYSTSIVSCSSYMGQLFEVIGSLAGDHLCRLHYSKW